MAKMEIPKGEVITGVITKHLDRRFLSSLDFTGCGTVEMTIDRVEKVGTLEYATGKTDTNALLIYFAETPKPLKLNVTNIRSIISVAGSNKVKDWKGLKVGICTEEGMFFGKMQHAVRIDTNHKG